MKSTYIDGEWFSGEGANRKLYSPQNNELWLDYPESSKEQSHTAIAYASKSFLQSNWRFQHENRKQVLLKASDLLETRKEEFARAETKNTGKPIRESRIDMEDIVHCFRYYADFLPDYLNEYKQMNDGTISNIRKEPIGVCGIIVPWNFPLLIGVWKLVPALAAGNCVVFKPSEYTPVTTLMLIEVLEKAGLPPGCLNVVTGSGEIGSTLVESDKVDKISFTGSVEVGKKIYEKCASSMKKVSLELGGKSPFIICEDVDVDKAAEWAAYGAYFNQGEVCVAAPRILVHESIQEKLIQKIVAIIAEINIGDPFNNETEFGPLIHKNHQLKVQQFIDRALQDGAKQRNITRKVPGEGAYVSPTLLSNVHSDMEIVQQEVFGPVATVQSFRNESEAIQMANETTYGLAAGILTNDKQKAERLERRLQAGIVWVNSYHTPYIEAPWGGMKNSGIGRELGPQGFESYIEYKHVNTQDSLPDLNWYTH